MIEKIVEFLKEAAIVVRENQQQFTHTSFKEERVGSVVTETDVIISRMFKKFIEENFSALNYIIIDEENLSDLGDDKFAAVTASEYQFVIDPIDGTHTFALGIPDYAVSVGILHYGKPWLGAICLPAIGDILYTDSREIYWMKDIYSASSQTKILQKQELSRLAVIFGNDWFVKINDNYDNKTETILSFYSAVVHLYYMITQRGKGYYFGSYIWDMAGCWPMLKLMGFEFYNYSDKRKLDFFSADDFTAKFKIADLHIICRSNDFERLKLITDLRK